MTLSILGLLAGLCFAYCGVPTAYRTYKAGKSVGTPIDMVLFIFVGSLLMYFYLFFSYGFDWILTINYLIQSISWGMLIYYHYKRP